MDQKQIEEIYESAKGFYASGKYAEALAEYQRCAQEGHVPSMNMLGYLYEAGKGTELDACKAVEWYKKSADTGNATAQYNLACCYKNGKGVEKSLSEAVRLFTASAEQGNVYAQYALAFRHLSGEGTPQSNDEYIKWITKSAFGGNLNAQYALGCDYFEATNGVEKNIEKAEILLKRPAQNGNARAQLLLGRIYKKGGAVPKNEEKAFELFESAAQREPEALYELGLCYYNSIGVKKSYYKALKYINEAAEAGVEKARKFIEAQDIAIEKRKHKQELLSSYLRCVLNEEQSGIEDLENARELFEDDDDDESKEILTKVYYWLALAYCRREVSRGERYLAVKAREYLKLSAERGYAQAQYILAHWYANGYGSESRDKTEDLASAIDMLKRAASQGHEKAKKELEELE